MSFVSVLFTLLILAALYFGYFEFQRSMGEKSTGTTAIDRTRDFACRTNRQTIERQITMWRVDHEGDPARLEDLGSVPTCPEGGSYSLSGGRVQCSLHP